VSQIPFINPSLFSEMMIKLISTSQSSCPTSLLPVKKIKNKIHLPKPSKNSSKSNNQINQFKNQIKPEPTPLSWN